MKSLRYQQNNLLKTEETRVRSNYQPLVLKQDEQSIQAHRAPLASLISVNELLCRERRAAAAASR